jgi:diacylglycerol kinase family enzyme
MNYFLIINPRSRNERNRWRIRRIIEKSGIRGMDFDHVFVSSYETIRAESEYANRKGYDAVIAVGGDGTINAVMNGFYDGNGNRISRSRFGVIYTGTSPDFCKSYGIPLDEDKAMSALTDSRIRQIRIGRILFRNEVHSGQTESRIFACCANIGLGAGVASVSNKIRKYTGDFAGTLIAVLWNLAADGSRRMVVSVDGVTIEIPRVMNISAGRTKFIASGIKVPVGISDDDERFYLLTAKNISLKTLPRLLYQIYSGNLTTTETLDLKYGCKMEFQSPDRPAGVEFDGDPAGFCPCTISLAPDPLDLIVYEE